MNSRDNWLSSVGSAVSRLYRASLRGVKGLSGYAMLDVCERYERLQSSVESALGQYLLKCESERLSKLLSNYRGTNVLVLSALEGIEVQPASAFQLVYKVCPAAEPVSNDAGSSLHSRFDALPFDSASFDVVVLQHVLEFSAEPQQVLKEAARVTIHGGHMFIMGFNPVSSHGLCSLLLARLRSASFWNRKNLLVYRVNDWLKFLDFNRLETLNFGYCLPLSNLRYLTMMTRVGALLERVKLPFAPLYCLVSRKDVPGMTNPKLGWKDVVLKTTIPVARPAQSTGVTLKTNGSKSYKIH